MKKDVKIWIDLSISDLKSAETLYTLKQYRNSYFLFQQSSEKATKALGIQMGEIINEKQLKEISHNPIILFEKISKKQKEELKILIETSKEVSLRIQAKYQDCLTSIATIEKLKKYDLLKIPTFELNGIYKMLIELSKPVQERLPYKAILKRLKQKSPQIHKLSRQIFQIMYDYLFIGLTFGACAMLTFQNHAMLTRYPVNGKNPNTIYTLKLPIVKKQPLFMNILKVALYRMKKNETTNWSNLFSKLTEKK